MTLAVEQNTTLLRARVIFGACLTQFTIIGLLISYGLFFKAFETEFGWSRTAISASTSIAFLLMGVLAILAGRLNDRFGPRLVLGIAGTVYGIGYAFMSQVTEIWHLFVLFGLCIGTGLASHDVVILSTVARWFPNKRGTMTGLVKTGTAAGQVAVPPFAALLLTNLGWQTALVVLGTLATGLLVIAAACMVNPIEETGSEPDKNQKGMSLAEARHTPTLWLLCAIQFLFFPTLMTVPLHIVVHAMDLGSPAATAALLLSTFGGASIVGRLASGVIVDRFNGKGGLVLCLFPLTASLLALMFTLDVRILFPIMAVYGFGHGGLFTVVSPTIADYFGLQSLGSIFGLVVFFGTLSGSVGPMVAGWIFDVTNSYFYAFGLLAAGAGLALLLTLMLPSLRDFSARQQSNN